jgi:hypothetical protein
MNMRGPARARSLAEGTYWVALKVVQFVVQEPRLNLAPLSNAAAAMTYDCVVIIRRCIVLGPSAAVD